MATNIETPDLDLQDSTAARGGPSLFQIAWQRKSLVILGILIGLVLGLLYYAQKQPIYQAAARVLVVKKAGGDPIQYGTGSGNVRSIMEDYMSTQAGIIGSPLIVQRTVNSMKELKSFPDEKEGVLVNSILTNLSVQRDTKDSTGSLNNILIVSFRGPVADECPIIIESVIKSYQDFLDDTYNDIRSTTYNALDKNYKEARSDLDRRNKDYQTFRQKLPTLLLSTGQGSLNIFAERLRAIETKRSEVMIKQFETKKRLEHIQDVYNRLGKEAAMYQIVATGVKIELLSGSTDLDRALLQRQLDRAKLIYAQGLGAKHPYVESLEREITYLRMLYGRGASAIANFDPSKALQAPNEDMDTVKTFIRAMDAEIEDSQVRLDVYDQLYEKAQQQARDLSNYVAEEEGIRDGIAFDKKQLEGLHSKLTDMNFAKESGGYYAQTIARPGGMGAKISPRAVQVFPIAGIAGLLAGLGLAYLAEISDKSFRTPAEIRRRLGLPVIGHIPFYVPDEKATKQLAAGEIVVDPMICTHYASNSLSSEAFRSVRTALYFNTQGVGHQVIQVTSPNVSDGKSTLAANLAVSIAQSGKRTILIDADCRRPRAHKIFGVSAESGLATVITGQADLATTIRPTLIPNLSILPCGPRPANPSELLTSPRFKELLDVIRAQYDFVIVDTPPLLVVTDPCVVAPRVDGVILAIRVTKNGRPFAERAKEILASLGANVLGVVVNGLGSQSGGRYGYGYDQYAYGYQYGYTYRYSYTYTDEYTDDKAATYYQDAPGAAGAAAADTDAQVIEQADASVETPANPVD